MYHRHFFVIVNVHARKTYSMNIIYTANFLADPIQEERNSKICFCWYLSRGRNKFENSLLCEYLIRKRHRYGPWSYENCRVYWRGWSTNWGHIPPKSKSSFSNGLRQYQWCKGTAPSRLSTCMRYGMCFNKYICQYSSENSNVAAILN